MASALTMRHRLLHEQMDKKQRKRNLIRMKNVCVCVCVCVYVYLCIVGQITYLKRNGISYEKEKRV